MPTAADALRNGHITPMEALRIMAVAHPSRSTQAETFELLARKVQELHQRAHDAEREIEEAWGALGHQNRRHMTLEEAISARLRDAAEDPSP